MPAFPGFIGGSGQAQSLIADGERTVNLYLEVTARQPALLPTPGFSPWSAAVADIGGRAALVADGRLFKVIGTGLYEYDTNGNATLRGTIASDANPAQLVYNGVLGGQLGIVSGGKVYAYTLATNVLSAALVTGGYTHLAISNNFGLAFNPTTGKTVLSNLNDLGTWTGANFFIRSQFPDLVRTMFVDTNGLIWLIGHDNFEVWYFANAASSQPFAPISGLVGRHGIAAPFAFALTASGSYWLAQNPEGIGRLVHTNGAQPQTVSTYAFHTAVARYLRTATISDAELLVYDQEGHAFVSVSFPSVPATWTLDTDGPAGQNMAERGAWNSARGDWDLWAPRVHVFAFGKHLITDRVTGIVSIMDTSYTTETDGATGIVRERTGPPFTREHARTPIDKFELLMDVGVGSQSGQGSDPQAVLATSFDGGITFGNTRSAAMGRVGKYSTRVTWNRLGCPANFVPKVRWTDPAPTRIVAAWVNDMDG